MTPLTTEAILAAQDTERALVIQAAARRRYFFEKIFRVSGTLVSISFASAAIVFTTIGSGLSPIAGAIAAVWVFMDRLVFFPIALNQRRAGVRLQSYYDSLVLGVGDFRQLWAEADFDEDIHRLSAGANLGRYRSWYRLDPGLSWPVNVLTAQLINATWGFRQHRNFAVSLTLTLTIIVTGEMWLALAVNLSLAEFLIALALPSLPLLLDGAENVQRHIQAFRGRRSLANRIRRLISSEPRETSEVERVQAELTSLRENYSNVPGWFYLIQRRRFEQDVTHALDSRP